MWRRVEVSTVLLLALTGCGGQTADHAPHSSREGTAKEAKAQAHSDSEVRVQMKGVDLVVDPPVVLEVHSLRGEFVPTREGEPPWFDEPASFSVHIDQGEVAMTAAGMSAVMNRYVFNYPGAPVKDIKLEIEGDHIKQTATIKKKVDLKTTIEGKLSVTPEGDIRLHPDKIKADGLPVKGLLDLFDVELEEMVKTRESRGVRIDENDFILDPEKLLPPPRITGRVTAVRIEGDRIIQTFGGPSDGVALKPSFPDADHYMFFRGGELSFGKLTMHGADLQIIDADAKDPFQFFLSKYARQLVAGESKTLSDKGLVVYMPDFDEAGN
ncbi:MAG: hypothetical protein QOH06_3842 [Acidobacteriota bacterium]|nr:hypothetical protein [Acidobacteriota bacterium]